VSLIMWSPEGLQDPQRLIVNRSSAVAASIVVLLILVQPGALFPRPWHPGCLSTRAID
jgi:hypothetical protein